MPENQVFTDEQIEEIISIFTQHLGHRQYIGARYVPIFGRIGEETTEWDNSAPYEPLTIVLHQGNSYTSRQYVPTGIDITNNDFWAETGNYNAQIEAYRQEVLGFSDRIDNVNERVDDTEDHIDEVEGVVNGLQLQVGQNTENIGTLQEDVTGLQGNFPITSENITPNTINRGDIDTNLLTKSEYMPIITAGFASFKSGKHSTPDGNTKAWLPSGMAATDDGNLYQAIRYSNSNLAAIYKYNMVGNTFELFKDNIDVGHANVMFYSPASRRFYVLPGMSDVTASDPNYIKTLFSFNEAFSEKRAYSAPESWGVIDFDHVTGKIMFAGFEGGIYEFDEDTNTFTDTGVTLDPDPALKGFVGQGGAIWNNLAYCLFGWNGKNDDNLIAVYDLATGKLVKTYILPLTSDIMPIGEVEDLVFTPNGTLYLANSCPFDKGNAVASISSVFKSGIMSEEPFGNVYSSLSPQSVRVEPFNTEFRPNSVSNEYIFRTISEALAYAKYNKVQSIKLYPSNTANDYYWFEEFLNLEGMGDIVFENPHDHVGILGGIYARGGATVRWDGELHIGMLYDVSWGSKIGLYLKNSSFVGSSVTINQGYDSAVRYGVLMEGASTYRGTSAPYLASGVTGTAMQDNSTGGHTYTPLS